MFHIKNKTKQNNFLGISKANIDILFSCFFVVSKLLHNSSTVIKLEQEPCVVFKVLWSSSVKNQENLENKIL